MSENIESMRKSLENRIWLTKKSRIKAETRLLGLELRDKILNIYYALFLVIVTMINYSNIFKLENQSLKNLDFLIMILSVIALVFSVYTLSTRYGERAKDMRVCYTELGKLEFKLKNTDFEVMEIEKVNNEYQDILKK